MHLPFTTGSDIHSVEVHAPGFPIFRRAADRGYVRPRNRNFERPLLVFNAITVFVYAPLRLDAHLHSREGESGCGLGPVGPTTGREVGVEYLASR